MLIPSTQAPLAAALAFAVGSTPVVAHVRKAPANENAAPSRTERRAG
jgi:hypothetical protein